MSIRRAGTRKAIYLLPGEGRRYQMGRIDALFKADNKETSGRYSVSEWWLKANTKGPGAHKHADDDIFFVMQGTMSFRLGHRWIDAPKGAFVLVPGGTIHDFENRTTKKAGVLNFSVPGGFESSMPGIVDWFQKHPPTNAVPKKRKARKS